MKKLTRRNLISCGLGLTAAACLPEFQTTGLAQEAAETESCWKYVPLDPQKAGQCAYDNYGANGCLYGAFKGAILTYADAIASQDEALAASVRAYPCFALRGGRGGFARLKQLCGAVAGGVMFLSCFVEDFADVVKLSEKLGAYSAETALPVFIPEKDEHPDFLKVVAHGLTCKEMGSAWMNAATEEQKKIVGERCKRHTASIIAQTVVLLNEYYQS